jgi:hypothetical protein
VDAERRRILDMLGAGKITADEAEQILDALNQRTGPADEPAETSAGRRKPRFLRVHVVPKSGSGENVNIRIPLGILRAGVKLGRLIPQDARDRVNDKLAEKGMTIDFDDLKSIEDVIVALEEMSIDVDDEKERVRICCE